MTDNKPFFPIMTIFFVDVVLCSSYGSLDEWTMQIAAAATSKNKDILDIASKQLIDKGYNPNNFDLEVLE
jgi:hypothetical protein